MEAVIQSLIAGFPILILHFLVTLAILAAGVAIYVVATPYREFALIKDGNAAAAISLSGAIVGLAIPLAFAMANSVNVFDILIWGVVTLVLQLIAFRLTDLLLRDLSRRIENAEIAPAIVLVGVKLAFAAINAAAVSG